MIRIQVTRQALLAAIQQKKPNWLGRAQTRTAAYVAAQDYTGGSEFWGEIKQVYIDLQHEKCAYCETKMPGSQLSVKSHEVEHFRPKSSVEAWPDVRREHWRGLAFGLATGTAHARGYYALAYHPFNYAIACTRCNSTLKSNYFPVRAARDVTLADPSQGWHEKPHLVYPLSDLDDDPESLITFDGVLAQAAHARGIKRQRALVTIAFFQLNHEDLTQRRARMLWPLWVLLETRATARGALRADADDGIRLACDPGSDASACMRAFCALHATNRPRAEQYAREARKHLPTPAAPPTH